MSHNDRVLSVRACTNFYYSGDKPLKEALRLMNNEGVTSLAVVDDQHNVVGNISNADVKVRNLSVGSKLLANIVLAPNQIQLCTFAREYMHTFHLCHSFYARDE